MTPRSRKYGSFFWAKRALKDKHVDINVLANFFGFLLRLGVISEEEIYLGKNQNGMPTYWTGRMNDVRI